jgi:uncharacterized protein YcbK (DUF882 family)
MHLLSRRRFAAALGAAALPGLARAGAEAPRELRFAHLHTGERLAVEYFDGRDYLADGLGAVNRLLRDFRTGDVATIDQALLDLLHALGERTGSRRPFEVISAYRSPATNHLLRARSDGVASGSLHLKGQAIDIRLADVPLAGVRDAALSLRRGGVGYYAGSNFVHVDTGRVRAW